MMNIFELKTKNLYHIDNLVKWIKNNGHNTDDLLKIKLDVNSNEYTIHLNHNDNTYSELEAGYVIIEQDGDYSIGEWKKIANL